MGVIGDRVSFELVVENAQAIKKYIGKKERKG